MDDSLTNDAEVKWKSDSNISGYSLTSGVSVGLSKYFAFMGNYTYVKLKGDTDSEVVQDYKKPYYFYDEFGYIKSTKFRTYSEGTISINAYSFGILFDVMGLMRALAPEFTFDFTFFINMGMINRQYSSDLKSRTISSYIEYESIPSRSNFETGYRIQDEGENWSFYLSEGYGTRFKIFGGRFFTNIYFLYISKSKYDVKMKKIDGTYASYTSTTPGLFYPNFNITYLTGTSWSFGLNFSGFFGNFFNYYNDKIFYGLELKTITLSIVYNVR